MRNAIKWRRGEPTPRHEDKSELFDYLSAKEKERATTREKELRSRYDLEAFRDASTRLDYRDNLATLDMLERLLGSAAGASREFVRVVDVGSKNFNYATALERFFKRWSGAARVELTGIEIDGYGIYPDFHSRADWANLYAKQTGNPDVRYVVEDFLQSRVAAVDVVTMFFPFVTTYATERWGLFSSLCKPEALVHKARSVLAPGGTLVVFNQTEEEQHVFEPLLVQAGFTVTERIAAETRLVEYYEATSDRKGTLASV